MSSLTALTLQEASAKWLELKAPTIQPRTLRDYQQYFRAVNRHLGHCAVASLRLQHVHTYQQQRAKEGKKGVSNERINHEVGCLAQLLREAGMWNRAFQGYKKLRVNDRGPGVALTTEQLEDLVAAGRRDTRWQVALHAAILSANTTAGPSEIKHLRLQDVELDVEIPVIHIRKGKNAYRVRTVPLNEDAVRSARALLERAYGKGACLPEHYLLPHRAEQRGLGYDPTKPQMHWNNAWNKLRNAAGMPKLRMYDLRHTAISRLLESPNVPERVVTELAGHVSNKMLQRYGHLRMKAKHEAVMAVTRLSKPEPEKQPTTIDPEMVRQVVAEMMRAMFAPMLTAAQAPARLPATIEAVRDVN